MPMFGSLQEAIDPVYSGPNVWRAMDTLRDRIVFAVAYRLECGRYQKIMRTRPNQYYRLTGTFSLVVGHTSEGAARAKAKKLYGYSEIADATEYLNPDSWERYQPCRPQPML